MTSEHRDWLEQFRFLDGPDVGHAQEPRRLDARADQRGDSSLTSARAWRLKMALRDVSARAAASNEVLLARTDLNAWLSWVRRLPA